MGAKACLIGACMVLFSVLCGCQNHSPARGDGPDSGVLNASAALIDTASSQPSPEPPRDRSSVTCTLAGARDLIGQPDSPAMRAAITRMTAGQPVRWIMPGAAITPDFQQKRLNVILDEDGRIQSLRCG